MQSKFTRSGLLISTPNSIGHDEYHFREHEKELMQKEVSVHKIFF